MNNNLLSLLGLCKKAGMLILGEEPVEAACRAKDARLLLVAGDAADNTERRVRHFAETGNCLWVRVPFTKGELGKALGRNACAILAVTDIGFAANITRRMAAEDPRYQETAGQLEIKAKRAAERKAEQQAHEKNLRQGKVRKVPVVPEKRKKPAKEAGPPGERASRPASAGKSDGPRSNGQRRRVGGDATPSEKRPRPRPDGRRFRADGSGSPQGKRDPSPRTNGPRPKIGEGTASQTGGQRSGFGGGKSFRPYRADRPQRKSNPFFHSRPVKKGKGSGRKKETSGKA